MMKLGITHMVYCRLAFGEMTLGIITLIIMTVGKLTSVIMTLDIMPL
jgi:hypothetical protein